MVYDVYTIFNYMAKNAYDSKFYVYFTRKKILSGIY